MKSKIFHQISSLSLIITSKVSSKFKIDYLNDSRMITDLKDYCSEIGLTQLIEKFRCVSHGQLHYFLACSPKNILGSDFNNETKITEFKKNHHTDYKLMIWINYSDADDHYGWHTVEEILEWFGSKSKTLKTIHEEHMLKNQIK